MYGYQQPSGFPGQNQFQNPYLERLMSMQAPQPTQRLEITRVSGKNGADAYQMPPNSSVLLLDDSMPIVWLKMTDGAGYATTTPYQISPYQSKPEPDYNSLDERISRLEAVINESHPASTKPEPKSKSRSKQSASDDAELL